VLVFLLYALLTLLWAKDPHHATNPFRAFEATTSVTDSSLLTTRNCWG